VLAAGLDDVDPGALGELAAKGHDDGLTLDGDLDAGGRDARSVELDDQLVAVAVDVVSERGRVRLTDRRELVDLLLAEGAERA
jgi:hypothetical protein